MNEYFNFFNFLQIFCRFLGRIFPKLERALKYQFRLSQTHGPAILNIFLGSRNTLSHLDVFKAQLLPFCNYRNSCTLLFLKPRNPESKAYVPLETRWEPLAWTNINGRPRENFINQTIAVWIMDTWREFVNLKMINHADFRFLFANININCAMIAHVLSPAYMILAHFIFLILYFSRLKIVSNI